MKPAVSVIIPVYGAERYMECCARGLFGQTLDDLEYIFVDDCTPDRSFDILKSVLAEYPRRQAQVRIIRHDTNRGVAEARTTGMKAATGEYMTHHDPDDLVPADAYASMYRRAEESGADIVTGSIISLLPCGEQKWGNIFRGSGMTALTTYQYRTNLWSSIIRTDLLHRHAIYPWPGMNYAEDSPVIMRAYAVAGKVEAIDTVVYHYNRMTEHSLSQISFAQKVEAMDIVVRRLSEWYRENTELTEQQISGIILNYKNRVKSDLLVKGTRDIRAWHKYWPEAARDSISRLGFVPRTIFKIGRYLPFVQGIYLDYLDFRSRNA